MNARAAFEGAPGKPERSELARMARDEDQERRILEARVAMARRRALERSRMLQAARKLMG